MSEELSTAQGLVKYHDELIGAGIDEVVVGQMVRDAAQVIISDEGLRVSA